MLYKYIYIGMTHNDANTSLFTIYQYTANTTVHISVYIRYIRLEYTST